MKRTRKVTPASVDRARQDFVRTLAAAYRTALRREFAGQPARIAEQIAGAGSADEVRTIVVADVVDMIWRVQRQAREAGL